jgi:hypothetical protein
MNAQATIHELSEEQIDAIVAKLPLPTLSEREEHYLMDDFANEKKNLIKGILLGEDNAAKVRSEFKRYRTYRLESMRWHKWVEANAVKFDHNRGKYVGIF